MVLDGCSCQGKSRLCRNSLHGFRCLCGGILDVLGLVNDLEAEFLFMVPENIAL